MLNFLLQFGGIFPLFLVVLRGAGANDKRLTGLKWSARNAGPGNGLSFAFSKNYEQAV